MLNLTHSIKLFLQTRHKYAAVISTIWLNMFRKRIINSHQIVSPFAGNDNSAIITLVNQILQEWGSHLQLDLIFSALHLFYIPSLEPTSLNEFVGIQYKVGKRAFGQMNYKILTPWHKKLKICTLHQVSTKWLRNCNTNFVKRIQMKGQWCWCD